MSLNHTGNVQPSIDKEEHTHAGGVETNVGCKRVAVIDDSGNQITSFGVDDKYPAGTGSNGSVTLTNADTAYAVPTTASTKKHVLVLYNGDDTDIYWGFQNTNANGVLLPPDGRVSLNLGASQQVYCYCGTAGKVVTYIYKEVS